MNREAITTVFDGQAASYDQQWSRMAPINATLHFLADAVFSNLPPTAHVLCIGAGTGAEILHLAEKFPSWRFTAVEPSVPMLEVFREKAEKQGILSRCVLHAGFLDSLPPGESFDGATAFLVSQFILDRGERTAFFHGIADRLRPGGLLVSSDLAGDLDAAEYRSLLEMWFQLMSGNEISAEAVEKMRQAYSNDVAVLPPDEVRDLIVRAGFPSPLRFYQAGMIHAWYARRAE